MYVHIAWLSLVAPALTFIWYLARRTDPDRNKALEDKLSTTLAVHAEKQTTALQAHAQQSTQGFARVEKTLDGLSTEVKGIGAEVIRHAVKIELLQRGDAA